MSLIKTRCRASRRSEVFSPVGVRLPNPYENVRLCLEFAIYQTHVNVSLIKTRCRASRRGEGFSHVGVRLPNPYENVHLCLEFAIYQTHVNVLRQSEHQRAQFLLISFIGHNNPSNPTTIHYCYPIAKMK